MELVEGNDLLSYISCQERITENDLVKIFYNFVSILRDIHEKGYIHRQLYPRNIIVSQSGDQSFVKINIIGLGYEYMSVSFPFAFILLIVNLSLSHRMAMPLWSSDVEVTSVESLHCREGFIAPEVHLHHINSYKTDIW